MTSENIIIENTEKDLNELYDNIEKDEDDKFNSFIKNRKPPMTPEKIDDLFNKLQNDNEDKNKLPSKQQIKKSLNEQSKNIAKQAKILKNKGEFKPDYEYIINNEDFFNKFLLHDLNIRADLNITEILHQWTNFKYSPFGELRTNYIKSISERVVCVEELGKIFNYNFMTYMNQSNYRFDCLAFELCKFIGITKDKDKIPTHFEYSFIHNMISRLLVCLLSNVDRCFSSNNIQININFKKAIRNDLNEFSHIIRSYNKISASWDVFETNLLETGGDASIYVFKDGYDLKEKLKECFIDYKSETPQFLLEQLLANTLKTYIPTIAYSYFQVIKDVYIMGRLLSIYVNKKLYEGKDKNKVMFDLYTIANSLTTEYEVNFLANLNTRSAPVCRNGNEMSKQTEMYYINHLIAGPQYYILKQLELSLPTLSKLFNYEQQNKQ